MATPAGPYNPGMAPSERSSVETVGFEPGEPLQGEVRVPGSKSIALRALVLSALTDGEVPRGLTPSADVDAGIWMAGQIHHRLWSKTPPGTPSMFDAGGTGEAAVHGLQAGESGTLARFATALAALALGKTSFRIGVRGTLSRRSSAPLFAALERAGAKLVPIGDALAWPLAVEPVKEIPERLELADPVSSQEVSALLIASAACSRPPKVLVHGRIPSRPYVGITTWVLARYGIKVRERALDVDTTEFTLEGRPSDPLAPLVLEPDASLAAVALAAACLSRGEIRVPGFAADSPQGDLRIVEHLRAFGCDARREGAALIAGGFPARAAARDLADTPDLVPVLAAVAAGAVQASGEWSKLTGLETLSRKESDRIAVLAEGLARAGWAVDQSPTYLRIGRGVPERQEKSIVLDPHGDHRMAFAFALLGLLRPGIRVSNPGCVAKTWPSFWEDFDALGATVERAR